MSIKDRSLRTAVPDANRSKKAVCLSEREGAVVEPLLCPVGECSHFMILKVTSKRHSRIFRRATSGKVATSLEIMNLCTEQPTTLAYFRGVWDRNLKAKINPMNRSFISAFTL